MLLAYRKSLHHCAAESMEAEVLGEAGRAAPPTDDALRDEVATWRGGTFLWGSAAAQLGAHWRHGGAPRRAALFRVIAAAVSHQNSEYEEGLYGIRGCAEELAGSGDEVGAACADAMTGSLLLASSHFEEALQAYGTAAERAANAGAGRGEKVLAESKEGESSALQRMGRYDESARRSREALVLFESLGDPRGRAAALHGIGYVHVARGEYGEAQRRYDESLAIYRTTEDVRGGAFTLNGIGQVLAELGDYAGALLRYQEALAVFRAIGDRRGVAYAQSGIGVVHAERGEYVEAQGAYGEAVMIFRAIGDLGGGAYAVHGIGFVFAEQGAFGEALEHQQEALSIFQAAGDRRGEAYALHGIGVVHGERGEHGDALVRQREALAIFREIGDRRGSVYALLGIGAAHGERSERAEALAQYEVAVTEATETGAKSVLAEALSRRAMALARSGNFERAAADASEATRLVLFSSSATAEVLSHLAAALAGQDPGEARAALVFAQQRGMAGRRLEALRVLAEVCEATGDAAGAAAAIAERDALWLKEDLPPSH